MCTVRATEGGEVVKAAEGAAAPSPSCPPLAANSAGTAIDAPAAAKEEGEEVTAAARAGSKETCSTSFSVPREWA